MIGNLRGFIRNEIISFEKELKEKANIAVHIHYLFENTPEKPIDKFEIECWHIDEDDDSDREYKVIFSTNSLNLINEYAISEVIKVIRDVMSQENKEKAIERFNDLDLMKYTGLEIIDK